MLSRLKTALRALLRRTQSERELDEELRYHAAQVDPLVALRRD